MTNLKDVEKYLEDKKKTVVFGNLTNNEFSSLVSDLLVSKNGYVADTCSGNQANWIILNLLVEKIKAHPKLWKWFFMVA